MQGSQVQKVQEVQEVQGFRVPVQASDRDIQQRGIVTLPRSRVIRIPVETSASAAIRVPLRP